MIFPLGLALSLLATCSLADEHERRLYKKLFSDYSIYERPVLNHTHAVFVRFQIVLNQLVDVDEKNQTILMNVWFKYEWTDQNLLWVPSDYGGVDYLSIPFGTLWKPDLLLYNSVGADFDMTYRVNYILYSDGLVNWIPPAIVKSSCTMDVAWFPFDDQRCELKFGSWTYGSRKLNLNFSEPAWDMSEYLRNGEWDILRYTVERTEKPYDCCRGGYITLKFTLYLRRRTLYYGFNKIVPSLLIALTAVLSFALPAESIEKITLEMTIFLSMYLFLDMLATVTPPTSDSLPFLGIFFSSIMILVTTSVVFNIMTLNLHYRTPYKCIMPPMVRRIFLRWLPPLLFMKPKKRTIRRCNAQRQLRRDRSSGSQKRMQNGRSPKPGQCNGNTGSIRCHRDKGLTSAPSGNPLLFPYQLGGPTGGPALSLELERGYRELRLIARDLKRKDDIYARAKSDWRYASRVVDRACLIILFGFVAVASLIVALSAHRAMG